MTRPSLLERAYQLADSGFCDGVTQIRKRLQTEGYEQNALVGKALFDDLRRRCRVAQGKPAEKAAPPAPSTAEERSERSRKAAEKRRANRPTLHELRVLIGFRAKRAPPNETA